MKRYWYLVAVAALILAVSLVEPVVAQYFPNVLVLDGSASAPSMTFNNNTNRGFFNDTANSGVGASVGGSYIGGFYAGGLKIGATGSNVSQITLVSASISPAQIVSGGVSAQAFLFPGLAIGDTVLLNPVSGVTGQCAPMLQKVTAAGSLTITFANLSGGACTPAAGTYLAVAIRS